MKRALALRHLSFEHAGVIEAACRARCMAFSYVEAPTANLSALDALAPELLIILGGPIGAYQSDVYPFLKTEIDFVRERLEAGLPTLGVCLGAQIMARAMGAEVRPGPQAEIGYAPITPTSVGEGGPLGALGEAGWRVLHWHGDVIEPFDRIEVLASTAATPVQAFAAGPAILGLQFHIEVEPEDMEFWLVGHARQLSVTKGVDPVSLRAQAAEHGAKVAEAGRKAVDAWLEGAL